jgi:hypothetical protein
MHIKVLEQVTFQILEGVTDETFLEAVDQANLFLRAQVGFVMRQVSWESMETALAAARKFNSSPETQDFNRLIKKETPSMSHYNVLSAAKKGISWK